VLSQASLFRFEHPLYKSEHPASRYRSAENRGIYAPPAVNKFLKLPANQTAFQADDEGSIPFTRSTFKIKYLFDVR
jgi:hypothetical protein